MAHCWRAIVALLVALLWTPAARADYPDFAAPSALADRNPEVSNRAIEPRAANTAPPQFSIRYPSPERQASAPAQLATDNAAAPQRLVAHERAIPLVPPSAESQARSGSRDKPPLLTGAASLGIVLGLFLLVVWAVRRGMPRSPTRLPREAVEILGRAPLVGRQQVHLVRCGNKVLLLSVSASSVETLTEITDPEEVERLADICQNSGPQGVSASFRHVLSQFGRSGGLAYLAKDEASALDFAHLEAEVGRRGREART